jgi:hypothetical protein
VQWEVIKGHVFGEVLGFVAVDAADCGFDFGVGDLFLVGEGVDVAEPQCAFENGAGEDLVHGTVGLVGVGFREHMGWVMDYKE